jgi:hypothetical protein
MSDVGPAADFASSERRAPPPRTTTDLGNWTAIALHLEVDRRTAKAYARREIDPLIVYTDHKGVYAPIAEANAWLARQRRTFREAEQLASDAARAAS